MFGIFDKLTEFFKDMLLGGIKANLESMFLDINDKVGVIATDVGKTPMGWNGEVYNFIKSINDNVIVPIAGLIITAVLCIELINMVMQKNNMHDTDTFEFFKYIIKMFIAVYLASHAFEFSMAVFDVAQNLVNKAAGVITTSVTVSGDKIVAMVDSLNDKGLGELIMILFETSLIKVAIEVIAIVIMLVVYGRMFEIYVYSSVSAIPFATMGNKEWGQIGTNYIKGLFAIGLVGLPVYLFMRNVVPNDIAVIFLIVSTLRIFFITLFEKDGLTFEKYFKYIYLHKFYQPQKRVRKEVYLERQKKDSVSKVRTKQKDVKKSKTGFKAK